MKILSVKLDKDMAQSLEDKSLQAGKSPESVLADMVSHYIHYSGWQQDLLELSIESIENGDFAEPEEVNSVFSRWGVPTGPAPESLVWSGLGLRAFRKELEHVGKKNPEMAGRLSETAWGAATDQGLLKRAFPGMMPGSLEIQLADGEYCMAFREVGGKRQIIGIIPSI